MEILTTSVLLDTCVLAELLKEDAYGYVLTQNITKEINVSESTLYPALRRLQKDGKLEAYDQPHNGRNRRYYRITSKGRDAFDENYQVWQKTKQAIDRILERGEKFE